MGGHPYLANRGLHEMVQKGLDSAALKLQAERDEGIFNDHLRRLLILLSKDSGLCDVVCSVLRGRPSSSTESFRRLRSAGVLAGESIDAMRTCAVNCTPITSRNTCYEPDPIPFLRHPRYADERCPPILRHRDADAVEMLVWRHGTMVFNQCLRIVCDEHHDWNS